MGFKVVLIQLKEYVIQIFAFLSRWKQNSSDFYKLNLQEFYNKQT